MTDLANGGSGRPSADSAPRALTRWWKGLIVWADRIGARPGEAPEQAIQRRLLVLFSIAVIPAAAIWSAIYFFAGAPLAAAVPGAYSIVAPLNTALFAWTGRLRFYRFTQLLLILILPFLLMMALGGFRQSSAVIIWSALAPLAALLLSNLRGTIAWIAGFVGLLAISAIIEGSLPPAPLSETFILAFFALNLGTVISIAFFLLYHFVRQRNFFQGRSEQLLLNILPKEISELLKQGVQTIANHHDEVSILFADIVGFTQMTAQIGPQQTVRMLQDVFECFDDLAEKHGVEKIKTIGDCYMAASGVPAPRPDHAVILVRMAIEMRDIVASRTFDGRRIAFRMGINSGPVVAGVIGRRKFIYDLWGDAVNLASRMESHGEEGAIQITRPTYERVNEAFDCLPLGFLSVKGAGEKECWRVLRPRPIHTDAKVRTGDVTRD